MSDFFFYSFYPTVTHSRSHSQLPLNFPTRVSTPSELSPLCLIAAGLNVIGPPLTHFVEVPSWPSPKPLIHTSDPRLRPVLHLTAHPMPTSLGFSGFRGFHHLFDLCWMRSMGNCYCCCCVQCVVGSLWWNGCVLGVDLGRFGVLGCWQRLIWGCVWLLGKFGTRIELLGDQIIVDRNELRLICVSNWVLVRVECLIGEIFLVFFYFSNDELFVWFAIVANKLDSWVQISVWWVSVCVRVIAWWIFLVFF